MKIKIKEGKISHKTKILTEEGAIFSFGKKICITFVNQNRYSYASHDYNIPSRFISELPEDKVEINDSKYIQDNNFLDNFLETDSFSEEIITPGRRRLLEN